MQIFLNVLDMHIFEKQSHRKMRALNETLMLATTNVQSTQKKYKSETCIDIQSRNQSCIKYAVSILEPAGCRWQRLFCRSFKRGDI